MLPHVADEVLAVDSVLIAIVELGANVGAVAEVLRPVHAAVGTGELMHGVAGARVVSDLVGGDRRLGNVEDELDEGEGITIETVGLVGVVVVTAELCVFSSFPLSHLSSQAPSQSSEFTPAAGTSMTGKCLFISSWSYS